MKKYMRIVGFMILSIVCLGTAKANLVNNGSFEADAIGTTTTLTANGTDSSTFTGWDFISWGAPAIDSFSGTIVDASSYAGAQAGSQAMRFVIDDTSSATATGADFMLNNDQNKIPVTQGEDYVFSSDVAVDSVTGNSMAMQIAIEEYNAVGGWLAATVVWEGLPTDSTFHNYSMDFSPTDSATTQVRISFRPRNRGHVSTLLLDNVQMDVVPEPTVLALFGIAATGLITTRRIFTI